MHWHNAAGRQQIIQNREDRFLDFTRIRCTAHQHDLLGKIHGYDGFADGAVIGRLGLETQQRDDGIGRFEVPELGGVGPNQKLACEERMLSQLSDDAHWQTVGGVGAAESILDEKFSVLGVVKHCRIERIEMRRRHGLVVVPPDLLFAGGVAHYEFVSGGTAGVLAGEDDHSAVLGDMTFLAASARSNNSAAVRL
jgi:hypothetical protein